MAPGVRAPRGSARRRRCSRSAGSSRGVLRHLAGTGVRLQKSLVGSRRALSSRFAFDPRGRDRAPGSGLESFGPRPRRLRPHRRLSPRERRGEHERGLFYRPSPALERPFVVGSCHFSCREEPPCLGLGRAVHLAMRGSTGAFVMGLCLLERKRKGPRLVSLLDGSSPGSRHARSRGGRRRFTPTTPASADRSRARGSIVLSTTSCERPCLWRPVTSRSARFHAASLLV